MMRMMKSVILMLLAAVALTMGGATVGTDAASRAASHFLSSGRHIGINASPVPMKLAYREVSVANADAADYYVFNAADGSAFVIIAGDDRAHEVLGYGEGQFDTKRIPDNMRWLLNHYAKQVEYLHAHPEEVFPIHSASHREGQDTVIPEMLTTRWGQGTPYRNLCPMIDGQQCVTGCVATAMAQVMNYWHYPAVLPALAAYSTLTEHIPVPALPAKSVQWELMQNTYPQNSYDEEQANAVAMLMRYCGQACMMDYGIASSSAWSSNLLSAFKTFSYSQRADLVSRVFFTDDEWRSMLLDDLSQMRPVIYTGHSSSINHTFVIDGYDGNKYHINWGWNGYQNGYYELDALTPMGLVPTDPQEMIYGLSPFSDSHDFDFIKNGIAYKVLDGNSTAVVHSNYYNDEIIIPDTVWYNGKAYRVTEIAASAFYGSSVKNIVLPQTLITIGESAFGNSDITQIIIPNSVTTIGNKLFQNCTSLKSITINSPLTEIVQSMFEGCTALTAFDILESITTISDNAFAGSGLIDITLPRSVSSVGKSVFKDCTSLNSVAFGSDSQLSIIGQSMFEGCAALSDIDIPESITTISEKAFAESGMTGITIPSAVLIVGSSAFKDCFQLSSLELQGNALTIGSEAFARAPLTDITCSAIRPPTANVNCFSSEVYGDATLHVLQQSIGRYQDTEPWKSFSHTEIFVDSTLILVDDMYYRQSSDTTLTLCFNQCGEEMVEIPETVLYEGRTFTVDAIGNYACWNNHDLIKLMIPQTVRVLGIGALSGSDNLTVVTIMSQDLSMGDNAFDGTAIRYLTCMSEFPPLGNASCFPMLVYTKSILVVPASSLSLYRETDPWSRFSNIVSFDGNLVMDGDYCYSLKKDHVAHIIRYFGNNQHVAVPETVVIDDVAYTVRAIGDNVFQSHSEINSVTLPATVRHIGAYAFDQCSHLNGIVFPDSLEYIGDHAFANCSKLAEIALPNSVRYMGCGAFLSDTQLRKASLGNGIKVIADSTFAKCSNLFQVSLGDSVRSIGKLAFYLCDMLNNISMPSSLSMIDSYAFFGCSRLKHLYISDMAAWCGVSIVDGYGSPFNASSGHLYLNGGEVIDCRIPDGVAAVNDYVFMGYSSIERVVMPATVTSIGKEAFGYCSSLTTINLPNGLTRLGDGCFRNCTKLESIIIPDSVTSIGFQAFCDCSSLSELRFGKALLSIGVYAFFRCVALTSLEFPDALQELGYRAFYQCSNVSTINFGSGLKVIGGNAFERCTALTELELPCGVTEIGSWVFNHCYNLTSVILPDSIMIISKGLFNYCSNLQHIEIPKLVSSIEDGAFTGCSSLNSIVVRPEEPPIIVWHSFDNVNYQNAMLLVPKQSVQAYMAAPEWKRFNSIVGVCMDETAGDLNCDNEVNIADINILIDAILTGEMDPLLDVNGDGELNVGDINEVISIILQPN